MHIAHSFQGHWLQSHCHWSGAGVHKQHLCKQKRFEPWPQDSQHTRTHWNASSTKGKKLLAMSASSKKPPTFQASSVSHECTTVQGRELGTNATARNLLDQSMHDYMHPLQETEEQVDSQLQSSERKSWTGKNESECLLEQASNLSKGGHRCKSKVAGTPSRWQFAIKHNKLQTKQEDGVHLRGTVKRQSCRWLAVANELVMAMGSWWFVPICSLATKCWKLLLNSLMPSTRCLALFGTGEHLGVLWPKTLASLVACQTVSKAEWLPSCHKSHTRKFGIMSARIALLLVSSSKEDTKPLHKVLAFD